MSKMKSVKVVKKAPSGKVAVVKKSKPAKTTKGTTKSSKMKRYK